MGDKLSYEFKELAKRFRRIDAKNPEEGQRQLDAACAIGGKLLKRASDAGRMNLASYPWPESKWTIDKDYALDEFAWTSTWICLLHFLSSEFPDWPSNVLGLRKNNSQNGVTLHKGLSKKDWRIQAENFACVVDDLAGLVGDEKQEAGKPASPLKETKQTEQAIWLATAMILVKENPEWSDAEIARRVDKHPSTLSRNGAYKLAAAMARGEKSNRSKGFQTTEGIEAYSDDPAEREWGD